MKFPWAPIAVYSKLNANAILFSKAQNVLIQNLFFQSLTVDLRGIEHLTSPYI